MYPSKSLVRKVSDSPYVSSKNKRRRSRSMQPKLNAGLQRYLSTRGTPNGVHEFTRIAQWDFRVQPAGITVGTNTASGFQITFYPGSIQVYNQATAPQSITIPGSGDLSALFDQIKIDKVEVRFINKNSTSPATGTVANNGTTIDLDTCIDFNDPTVPTSNTTVTQYDTCKSDCLSQDGKHTQYVTLKPMFQTLVSYTTLTSSNLPQRGYLPADEIPHYGIKGWVNGQSGSQSSTMRMIFKVHYKCKNVR